MSQQQRRASPPGGKRVGAAFVDVGHGIFSASGTWFHTTVADLEEYAPQVISEVPVGRLITEADVWLRLPENLSLFVLLGTLAIGTPLQAVLAALATFVAAALLGPGLVNLPSLTIARVIDKVPVQGVAFIGVLSWLGVLGYNAAVVVGLVGFIVVRWGVVRTLLRRGIQALAKPLYALPLPDQTLRALITRYALKLRVPLDPIEQLAGRMIDRWTK